ncbi:UNVERIFIED_CONTAM: hypothetical protein Scaly_2616000 [Sesamum calycinum]|uniref:Uncharacterized protein n=1 Tax=Sesamum calycinum TaxID=2727403 RepID=A0AAW2JBY2_9LAMI
MYAASKAKDSVSVDPAECFRCWSSFRSIRISPLHRKFPLPLPYSSLVVSTTCPGLSPGIGFDGGLKKPPTDALRPIIPDNACILCLTAAAGTELADAYSPRHSFFSGKRSSRPVGLLPPRGIAPSGFRPLRKIPTAASRRSLGRVSVPVWLIILSDQLLIIALPFPAVVPLPKAGSYALLTRPPLETPLPVRLACVKHAASVHPEPGSNSPCASYSPGVRSQKYSHPCPLTSIPRASYPFSLNHGGGANQNRKTHIGFRDNQARTDDFHHVKVTLYR